MLEYKLNGFRLNNGYLKLKSFQINGIGSYNNLFYVLINFIE